MARSSPLEQARRWWKERADTDRYVVSPAEAPSSAVARVLRQEGLVLDAAGKRAWILTPGNHADGRAAFLANYWPVLALVLQRYEPAAVAGIAAIRLLLEDLSVPEELPAYQGANQSEYRLILYPGFRLRLRPRALEAENRVSVTVPGSAPISVQSPADILTTLDEGDVTAGLEPLSAWLRHLVVRTPDLESAAERNPRPVILKRLAALAVELHNDPLARHSITSSAVFPIVKPAHPARASGLALQFRKYCRGRAAVAARLGSMLRRCALSARRRKSVTS